MRLRIVALLAAAALLAACGGSGNGIGTPGPTLPPAGRQTPAAAQAAVPAANAAEPTGPLPQLKLQRAGNLAFSNMTNMQEVPGSPGRFVVLEKAGRAIAFDVNDNTGSLTTVLDIRGRVDSSSSETGLLGLAFAPDFATSRAFYLNYTAPSPLRTVVSRFTMNPNSLTANPDSEAKIIEIGQPFTNHNGGELRFGPDGMLYMGMGDGGSANDPQGNGQKRDALLGKMLRIDVSGSSEGRAYRIPPDNPFVGQRGTREEIWAIGMRNPWRFSFDRVTGFLWVGDVGQNAREEVDIIKKGANYGWNIMEGAQCRSGNNCDRSGLELPVIDYPTANGNCAIVGGSVYHGEAIPNLRGAYVYGDYCSGRIWALRYDGSRVTEQAQIAQVSGQMSSFTEDSRGEIYVLAFADRGGIFRLVP